MLLPGSGVLRNRLCPELLLPGSQMLRRTQLLCPGLCPELCSGLCPELLLPDPDLLQRGTQLLLPHADLLQRRPELLLPAQEMLLVQPLRIECRIETASFQLDNPRAFSHPGMGRV